MRTDSLCALLIVAASSSSLGCGDAPQIPAGGGSTNDAAALVPDSGSIGDDATVPVQRDAAMAQDGALSGTGVESECDGVDNDGNGSVDDVDLEKDGVCDCLSLAVLGDPGWHRSTVFRGWLQQRANNGGVTLTPDQITAESLRKYQVLVVLKLTGLPALADREVSVIEDWVKNGGGLMVLSGFDFMSLDNANHVLSPFGLSFATDLVLFNLLSTNPVTEWTQPHPVTAGITSIGYNNGNPVEGGGTVLARGANRDLMRAVEVDKGRVLVWGDEWITFDTEWSSHPEYQVERLWLNSLKWLTTPMSCQVPIVIL